MITHKEVIEELEREFKVRSKIYPEWIRGGKIKPTDAKHRIDCIKSAIEKLKETQIKLIGTQEKLF